MSVWRVAGLAGIVVSLLLVGCGSDPKPDTEGPQGGSGGATGSGGTGGAGGDGGSGGSGGTGGSEPRCGDGHVDPDEACDDGNEEDEDGCSSSCEWEGSCENPIDYFKVATPHEEFPEFFLSPVYESFHGFGVDGAGRCGGGGRKMVFRYVAPASGRLVFLANATEPDLRAYVRRTCDDPASEVRNSCKSPHPDFFNQFEVVEGELLWVIVDSPSGDVDTAFQLGLEVFPHRTKGDTCGPTSGLKHPHMWQCEPGFTCSILEPAGICVPNEAPTLLSARALIGGEQGTDLFVTFEVTDPNGDLRHVEGRLRDEDGEPVSSNTRSELLDWDFDEYWFFPDIKVPRAQVYRGFSINQNFVGRLPDTFRIDLTAVDNGGLRSEPLSVFLEPQPLSSEGEGCDPLLVESICEAEDLICRGPSRDESICESRLPDRLAACEGAEVLAVGDSRQFEWDLEDFEGHQANWPLACVGRTGGSRFERPEFVFRLQVDRPHRDVSIRVGVPGVTGSFAAVALLGDCGLAGEVLACRDAGSDSSIALEELEAGEYLVVVSAQVRSRGRVHLVIEGTPQKDPPGEDPPEEG